jgi:diguanylate cyclase (GGDEF)-like protein
MLSLFNYSASRIHYFVQEQFAPSYFHWMGGDVAGYEQAILEAKLRKRLARLQLAPGSNIAEILKHFILDVPASELLVLLELMPQALTEHLQSSTKVQASHRPQLVEQLRGQVVELLHGFGIDMAFSADGKLEPTDVDTASRALDELPKRDVLPGQLGAMLLQHPVVSVVFVDLDGFKAVNDRISHKAGDECLHQFVTLVSPIIKGKGRHYRYGGDEFVVVMPNYSAEESAATAERIRKAVEEANIGGDVRVTTSIGVASASGGAADALLEAADQAMYASKFVGKNRVTMWPLDSELATRVTAARAQAKSR